MAISADDCGWPEFKFNKQKNVFFVIVNFSRFIKFTFLHHFAIIFIKFVHFFMIDNTIFVHYFVLHCPLLIQRLQCGWV